MHQQGLCNSWIPTCTSRWYSSLSLPASVSLTLRMACTEPRGGHNAHGCAKRAVQNQGLEMGRAR